MKILQINSVCGIKSTGRICTDLAEVLEKNDHEVKIAYGRDTVPEKYQKYAIRICNDFDVKKHGIKSRLFDRHGFGSKKATKEFIEWVKKYDPDIIHLHNIHGYYINVEILFNYLRTCNKKIIWTLHDCWAFTGHCSHFSLANCYKWKNQCSECPQKSKYPKSIFKDNSFKNYQQKKSLFCGIPNMTIVTPSKWLADLVKESFLKEYPVEVIHNGIDLNVFKPTDSDLRKQYGLENKKVILGVSSVWNKEKGFEDFIKLSTILEEQYQIVLIGVSKHQLKNLPKNIIGIEHTNNIFELAQWYTTADVYVNMSQEETMGLTTVEALACGTSVIVYNKTAIPEVPDNTCGIVLSENTPEAILKTLSKIDFVRQNCILRAEKFKKEDKYKEYIDTYGV